jgi:hypothetical protein
MVTVWPTVAVVDERLPETPVVITVAAACARAGAVLEACTALLIIEMLL